MNVQDKIDEDDGWIPPTDAEMKVILARRERADKISKLMGEYLLKGYKMLAISCEDCGTILLKDKHDVNYCVACSELDTDLAKDDPALSTRAANSQVQEGEFNQSATNQNPQRAAQPVVEMDTESVNNANASSSSHPAIQPVASSTRTEMLGEHFTLGPPLRKFTFEERESLLDSEIVLHSKLAWATLRLKEAESIEDCIPLCELIKACAEALRSVGSLIKNGN